jgi:hypothetical protein
MNDDAATLATKTEVEKHDDNETTATAIPAPERGTGFWLVFFAICLALFVSALDAVRFATACLTREHSLTRHHIAHSIDGTANHCRRPTRQRIYLGHQCLQPGCHRVSPMDRLARYNLWKKTSHAHCPVTFPPWEWTVRRSLEHEHVDSWSKCAFTADSLNLYSWTDAFDCILAVQGLGAGANQAMTEIIVSDLVPVAERGLFFGIIGM